MAINYLFIVSSASSSLLLSLSLSHDIVGFFVFISLSDRLRRISALGINISVQTRKKWECHWRLSSVYPWKLWVCKRAGGSNCRVQKDGVGFLSYLCIIKKSYQELILMLCPLKAFSTIENIRSDRIMYLVLRAFPSQYCSGEGIY